MKFEGLSIFDVKLIRHAIHKDARGELVELFRYSDFVDHCGDFTFVQDNLSRSRQWSCAGYIIRLSGHRENWCSYFWHYLRCGSRSAGGERYLWAVGRAAAQQ